MSRSVSWTIAAAAALVLGACGSDDDPAGPVAGTAPQTAAVVEAAPTTTAAAPTTTASPEPEREPEPEAPADLTPARALGQMVVARFDGLTPSPALLRRIRRGQVGGVILFKDNVTGGTDQVRRLVRRLQAPARQGGHPALLVMIDQEGGEIRRLPGPPEADAADMGSASAVRTQGRLTGRALKRLGITVDLAPVADVSSGRSSFLGGRAFGTAPATVASRACAFVAGLRSGGVAATLKHFPGLGRATTNTDFDRTRIAVPLADLRRDYAAYRRCGAGDTTLVMLSSAIYPDALGPDPAVLTSRVYRRELRRATGGRPLTISDDLETPSVVAHATPSRRAVNAGLDLLLYARTEQASVQAYDRLLADVRAGRIDGSRVQDAATRILALKARLEE